MKKIQLLEQQIHTLTHLPESGMGYQNVKLTFKNGDILNNLTVQNSEFLVINNQVDVIVENICRIELA